jgi:YidC/Oxa1 family membrane protein insertase
MATIISIFNTVLFQPLLNALVFLYTTIPGQDLGIAIIILTLLLRLLLWPLSYQSIRSQRALQQLQPKLDALKKQYGKDREQLARETMKLYKEEKVNPLSSCLPLLIQLPFLIAVYHVFAVGLNPDSLSWLYPFVKNPGSLQPVSFGFLDLSKASIPLAIVTGAAQYLQTRMLATKRPPAVPGSKDEDMMATMNRQMQIMMPAMTIIIGISLPSGLVLYWLVTTVLTIGQQYLMFRTKDAAPAAPAKAA